jgi:hypothetical protein
VSEPITSGGHRQAVLLGVLLVVLAFAGWYYYWPTTTTASSSQTTPATTTAAEVGQLPVPETVKLATLEGATELSDAGRNPFAYGVRPPPPAPPRPPAPPPMAPVVTAPPAPVGPPPIGLRLIALLEMPQGRKMVTLKDPTSNAFYNGFEGDVVDGRYRIIKIGIQSVTVSYVDGSGQRTIGFSG